MLDAELNGQLAAYLRRITQPVEISAFVDDGKASQDMRTLLDDIAQASPHVRVNEVPAAQVGPNRTPLFAINRPGENHGPRFAGLPMGHEFTLLVLALLQVGGYPPKVEQQVLERIRALEGDFDFEVYVSLSCHNCPDMV